MHQPLAALGLVVYVWEMTLSIRAALWKRRDQLEPDPIPKIPAFEKAKANRADILSAAPPASGTSRSARHSPGTHRSARHSPGARRSAR